VKASYGDARQQTEAGETMTRQVPRYKNYVPGMSAALVVPLLYKTASSARSTSSAGRRMPTMRPTAAVAAVRALTSPWRWRTRAVEQERKIAEVFETLAEIAARWRDSRSRRAAHAYCAVDQARHDYRTFAIMLSTSDADAGVQARRPVRRDGEQKRIKLGEGSSAMRRISTRSRCSSPTCPGSRYLKVIEDVRSELVIPLMLKDRCIGVFDLASRAGRVDKRPWEILTFSRTMPPALENARLYATAAAN